MLLECTIPDAVACYRRELGRARDRCGRPFDWERFCSIARIRVKRTNLYFGNLACLYASRAILVDKTLSQDAMRCAVAHEIGHWILENKPYSIHRRTYELGLGGTLGGRLKDEAEADRIAESLLVSPQAILDLLPHANDCILRLISLLKFDCRIPWPMAIRRVLRACCVEIGVAEIGPSRECDPSSLPCVLTYVGPDRKEDVLPISVGLARTKMPFSHLGLSDVRTSFEIYGNEYGSFLPRALRLRRVSEKRILIVFEQQATRGFKEAKLRMAV